MGKASTGIEFPVGARNASGKGACSFSWQNDCHLVWREHQVEAYLSCRVLSQQGQWITITNKQRNVNRSWNSSSRYRDAARVDGIDVHMLTANTPVSCGRNSPSSFQWHSFVFLINGTRINTESLDSLFCQTQIHLTCNTSTMSLNVSIDSTGAKAWIRPCAETSRDNVLLHISQRSAGCNIPKEENPTCDRQAKDRIKQYQLHQLRTRFCFLSRCSSRTKQLVNQKWCAVSGGHHEGCFCTTAIALLWFVIKPLQDCRFMTNKLTNTETLWWTNFSETACTTR